MTHEQLKEVFMSGVRLGEEKSRDSWLKLHPTTQSYPYIVYRKEEIEHELQRVIRRIEHHAVKEQSTRPIP